MRLRRLVSISIVVSAAALAVAVTVAQQQARPSLSAADIAAIARLLMLEDTRELDEAAIGQALRSTQAEVRRRAAMAIGRIAKPAGGALLPAVRTDPDPAVVAAAAFATGQLKDPATVGWLDALLSSPNTTPDVAREAARSLGKIAVPESRAALARYLSRAPNTQAATPPVGEALLSIGRFTTREDLAPIIRWTKSGDAEVRWRATWALFRPRDPAAMPELLRLSADPSAEVRFWAMRGLGPIPAGRGVREGAAPAAEPAAVDPSRLAARLREGVRDPDRRVRTEALRALALYDDDPSFDVVLSALDSDDTWMSVSAAEAMGRFQARATVVVPRLVAAAKAGKPLALRITALTPLTTLAPEAALDAAAALAGESSATARMAARQALTRLGEPGRARLDALAKETPPPAAAAAPRPPAPARTEADYRQVVERWIVPDYNGAARPRAILETPRGRIEVELNPGDAPLGVEYFAGVVSSGDIVGTEFGRVVPNFVAQQRAIRPNVRLRDEVSRLGLLRGTLSWASAGLDTGNPGYTLGNTPQPHNEGNFTALGRVVAGMDVVDRLELGDRITGATMKR
jgi:HEAT repeat protein/cyclophilin family peptidyl-prolyl cis-trans isomerase